MNKLLLTLLLGILLISFASAETFILNEELDVTVICINDGYCSNASYCNINIIDPEGIRNVTGQNMTNQISFHNYTITPTKLGEYQVGGFCIDGEYSEEIDFTFGITLNGESISTGSGILYSLFSLILFGIICIVSFFIITLPYENDKDDQGFVTKVVRLKYFRPVLIVVLYLTTLILTNFLNGIAINFTSLSIFAGTLGFIFETMMRLSWPFTAIILFWIVVMLVKDTNVNKQLDKFDKFDPFKKDDGRF